MKDLTLIDNWKNCYKLATFQIAIALIILEGIQSFYVFMPDGAVNWLQSILIIILPIARMFKLKVKDS